MKRLWNDTLFKRLFVLMWVALVASHVVAYTIVMHWAKPGGRPQDSKDFSLLNLPVLPSLPPTPGLPGLPGGPASDRPDGPPPPPAELQGAPGDGGPPEHRVMFMTEGNGEVTSAGPPKSMTLSAGVLLLDYGVRFLIIGIAAWWGARWVSAPMRQLAAASHSLASSIGSSAVLPKLDDRRGTVEVRETAKVFNEMAMQLDEQFKGRGLLVAAISHDLRTPLTRVRMRLESFESEPAAQRCIADVREMNELIDSSLELFRGAGPPEQSHAIDVQALVQSLCDDMAEQGHAVSASGHHALVEAQPCALRRTLSNLIGNAVRYGDRADVTVLREAEGVKIHIDDAGPGIPEAHMQAVFQPFYRLESSRNRKTGGTGLGLYIARDLIGRQSGTLTLANRRGGGLRATIFLPHRG